MAAQHEIRGWSSYPYATSPASAYEERAKRFNWAFKNGRGYEERLNPTFPDVVRGIVRGAAKCPVFGARSLLVPIPRSGNSRTSFKAEACLWPVEALAHALVGVGVGGHAVELLLDRPTPIRRSSDSTERASVDEHAVSVRARIAPPMRNERVILLDDLLVKGTQAMACMIAMRRAGHTGPIEAFFVHQSVAPNPTDDQRQPFLEHRILWDEGQRLARRIEVGCWHRTPAAAGG